MKDETFYNKTARRKTTKILLLENCFVMCQLQDLHIIMHHISTNSFFHVQAELFSLFMG